MVHSNNHLKANPDKFHLLLSDPSPNFSVHVDQYHISNSSSEKLLGITIDNQSNFNEHVTGLCKKASQKLHAHARISIMKAFINA